jgi:hypothetical protein
MKYVITERQYKIITEQTDDIDWLINWFKKVPEEKLKRTFTTKDAKGKVWTLGRNEILKLLSSDNFVIVTDPSEKLQNGLDITPASYSPPSNSKYPGKILISGDWKKIIKTSPTYKDIKNPMGTVIHHEKIHNLQYQQADTSKTDYDSRANANNKSKWSKKISGFCKLNTNPFCKKARAWDITGYLKKPEEIYAHLFTIREYLGIQPMDIITNVNVTVQNEIEMANISVSVSREGKTIQLPIKNMDTKSTTFEILYCCNKSFKETLMYLHNTLANIEKPKDSESDVMV